MDTQEMYDYYMSNNVSLKKAGEKFGISANGLRKRFLKAGLKMKGRNSTRSKNIDLEKLRRLYCEENMSMAELAKEFKCAHGTIYNKIRKMGISKSPRQAKADRSDDYTVWSDSLIKRAKYLLEQTRSIKETARLLDVSENTLQDKNSKEWEIPLSIWFDRQLEESIRNHLENTKSYENTARHFNISLGALRTRNSKKWHVDLSDNMTLFGTPTIGNDKEKYQSKIEARFANRLFNAGIEYERQVRVCNNRRWTCDFKINNLHIEIDGLDKFRRDTGGINYASGQNEKIRYYRENDTKYFIVNNKNFESILERLGAPEVIKWAKGDIEMREVSYCVVNQFCARYHYLGGSPKSDSVRLGFYLKDKLVAIITFGKGTNQYLFSSLVDGDVVNGLELTRLCILPAVDKNFASCAIAMALRSLRKTHDIVVSFADSEYEHCGYVYQAANFIYTGKTNKGYVYVDSRENRIHKAKFRCKDGKSERELAAIAGVHKKQVDGKHRYIYVLNKKLKRLKFSSMPYPKSKGV